MIAPTVPTYRTLSPGIVIAAVLAALCVGGVVGWFGLLGAAGVIGVLVGVYLVRYPLVLVPALLILTALGQIGRVPPGSTGSSLLLGDGVAILLCVLAAFYWISRPKGAVPVLATKAGIAWIGLLGVMIVSWLCTPLIISNREMAIDAFYWVRLFGYSSAAWVIAALSLSESIAQRAIRWLLWTLGVVVAVGLIQLYVFPDIRVLGKYGWDPHVGRLVSTFLDPNYLGGFFAVGLAVLGAYILVYRPRTLLPWIGLVAVVLASLLTYSRSGYLAVLIVVCMLGIRYSWKILVLAAMVSIPLGLSIPRVQERIAGGFSIDATSKDRIESWQNALDIAAMYQPIGLGYNHYRPAQEIQGLLVPGSTGHSGGGSDSTLLNILTTTGPIGLCLFSLVILTIIIEAHRQSTISTSPSRRVAAIALLAIAPALVVHSFFVNAFVYPFILLPLCVLIGILYRPDASRN